MGLRVRRFSRTENPIRVEWQWIFNDLEDPMPGSAFTFPWNFHSPIFPFARFIYTQRTFLITCPSSGRGLYVGARKMYKIRMKGILKFGPGIRIATSWNDNFILSNCLRYLKNINVVNRRPVFFFFEKLNVRYIFFHLNAYFISLYIVSFWYSQFSTYDHSDLWRSEN